MSNSEIITAKDLLQQVQERGLLNSNSTVQCVDCKVAFPIEYNNCPQCEIDALWCDIRIQIKNNFEGKQN